MTTQLKIQEEQPDPQYAQRAAADPGASVWVAASAGSGKTKVLTDRVLRLMLPRADGLPGTPPERILCLTFTKAGASEMSLRISQTLALWATMPLIETEGREGLASILTKLLGRTPSDGDVESARRLFARVVDAPGGLKIMTIHAFCQSVLGRFPLEAGLPPHFTVLSAGTARELMQQARDYVLKNASRAPQSELSLALGSLAAALNEDQFESLMQGLGSERQTLKKLLKENQGANSLYHRLCAHLDLDPEDTKESLIRAACDDAAFPVELLRQATKVLYDSTKKTDQETGQAMAAWLSADIKTRAGGISEYKAVFLTREGAVRSTRNLGTNEAEAAMPGLKQYLQDEGNRLQILQDKLNALECARMTHNLLIVGQEIITRYQELKNQQAGLDFDDMINHTRDLLTKSSMAAWVLYKLDGGLDHILVDEAQDTNPEQWDIVQSLICEFFAGQGARDIRRTLFVVGDEKQSIFSFQRAAPDRFREKREEFRKIVEEAGNLWKPVPMDISFRSTKAVLDFTDAVFADKSACEGVSDVPIRHFSFRAGHAGHIEQWPLFRVPKNEEEERSPWEPVFAPRPQKNARVLLAQHIAFTIKSWIASGEILPSQGRAVQPGDIMILVNTRNALVGHMIRELKAQNIPVNGLDRMKLGQHIAIEDMMALARFALLPEDDLTLACILKSPFINWSDGQLEEAALERPGTLWQALQDRFPHEAAWLSLLIEQARTVRPYEFFSRILQSPCPASPISGLHAMTARLSGDVMDPLDEFLSQVLDFEGDHISTVQGFVLWQQRNETEITREQEDAAGRIRIMTVHASKGLQAPIVILPDTVKMTGSNGNRATDRLLWPAKTGLPFPFWSSCADNDCLAYKKAKERALIKDQEEYRRLLYVALTRAEDRLYIGGAGGSRAHDPNSWFELTKAAFASFEGAREAPFYSSPAVLEGLEKGSSLTTHTLTTEQEANPVIRKSKEIRAEPSLPDLTAPAFRWCREPAPAEPAVPRPLIPSQTMVPLENEPAALSPLAAQDNYRFRRGVLTHRLLQFLPELEYNRRRESAQTFIERYGHDLPKAVRDNIVAETMDILTHPEFSALFGPASRSEIPLTGLIEGKLVSGQIDRLLITDTDVHIIDYKTNRPPPQKEEDVPQIYRAQLKAYRDTLAGIYPHHRLRTYLLWTDGPRLMEIFL